MFRYIYIIILFFISLNPNGYCQEFTGPLFNQYKWSHDKVSKPKLKRTTPIQLPIFENFSYYDYSVFPTDNYWIDSNVYINNHFTNNQSNKGIATFDILDKNGNVYENVISPFKGIYADSLTSYKIDLSSYQPEDSIFLSFNYLCKGLGFAPKSNDSLLIYIKDSINGWILGSYILPNTLKDWSNFTYKLELSSCFYTDFQFRIINKATIGNTNSHWHLDNIYMDAHRSYYDRNITNVAFTIPSQNILNNYTSIPFKHYINHKINYTNTHLQNSLINKHPDFVDANNTITLISKNYSTNTELGTSIINVTLPADEHYVSTINNINPNLFIADTDGRLIVENTFYIAPSIGDTIPSDDTIRHYQYFDNYFAYDDGTAEQSYFLKLNAGSPGKVVTEYLFNTKDTIAALDIMFAQQFPHNFDKEFFIQIYKDIELNGNGGNMIYQQSGCFPTAPTSNQGFTRYPLEKLVPVDSGVYYIGIMMPANGVSDSLMIGLDVNRQGGNYRYYNVLDKWESSTLEGATMMRPIVSSKPLNIPTKKLSKLTIYPNPTYDVLHIESDELFDSYSIINTLGTIIKEGNYQNIINVKNIPSGNYILHLKDKNGNQYHKAFVIL